jgi:hypothetical protein
MRRIQNPFLFYLTHNNPRMHRAPSYDGSGKEPKRGTSKPGEDAAEAYGRASNEVPVPAGFPVLSRPSGW